MQRMIIKNEQSTNDSPESVQVNQPRLRRERTGAVGAAGMMGEH